MMERENGTRVATKSATEGCYRTGTDESSIQLSTGCTPTPGTRASVLGGDGEASAYQAQLARWAPSAEKPARRAKGGRKRLHRGRCLAYARLSTFACDRWGSGASGATA